MKSKNKYVWKRVKLPKSTIKFKIGDVYCPSVEISVLRNWREKMVAEIRLHAEITPKEFFGLIKTLRNWQYGEGDKYSVIIDRYPYPYRKVEINRKGVHHE